MLRRRLPSAIAALAGLAAASAAAAAAPPKAQTPSSPYVRLPTVTATVVRAGGRRGVMTVDVGLEAEDPALRTAVDTHQPRLRAAFAERLRRYAGGLGPEAAPDADLIARELQRATDQVLGKAGARLLLGAILIN